MRVVSRNYLFQSRRTRPSRGLELHFQTRSQAPPKSTDGAYEGERDQEPARVVWDGKGKNILPSGGG